MSALPRHCIALCGAFFLGAIAISVLKDLLPERYARLVPIPMAAAIPFYIGANLAVRICQLWSALDSRFCKDWKKN
jgi:hypothetical protein